MRHPTAIRSLLGLVLIYLCTKLSGVLGIVDSLGNILEPDSVVIVGIDVNSTDQPSTYRHIWNSSYGMKYCRELPDNGNKMWLMGELGEAGGLCNQLFGVFSYAPVALLYNASLIVGDMLTRLTFNRVYQASNFVRVPFSEFFNFEHFATYWQKNRGLIVVDKNDYNNCLDKIKKNGIVRTQGFFPMDDNDLLKLLKTQNISVPENSQANKRIFRIIAEHKFVTISQFRKRDWQANFYDVMNSLRPAAKLQAIVNEMHKLLPKRYISAHFRLEGDVVSSTDEGAFKKHLNHSIAYLITHKCFENVPRLPNGSLIEPPMLYISSGLFKDHKPHRVHLLRSALAQYGITEYTSSHHLMSSVKAPHRGLYAEQDALIDFTMSKESDCFVPAGMLPGAASSFSYLVKVLQLMSQGVEFQSAAMEKELGSHNMFSSWWRR